MLLFFVIPSEHAPFFVIPSAVEESCGFSLWIENMKDFSTPFAPLSPVEMTEKTTLCPLKP